MRAAASHRRSRLRRSAALVVLACAALAPAALAGGGPGGPVSGYGPHKQEARAVLACAYASGKVGPYRTCLESKLLQLIVSTHDPADELPRIDAYAHSVGGWLPANCHILMHAVGRRYAIVAHVTLENLYHSLPKSNDPGCSAGFAHGLLIALGPAIQKMGPEGAAAECAKAATRYERYSCVHGLGHAYARLYLDYPLPALASCKLLGPDDAADCAQGVFHDYWIAVDGLDATKRHADMTTSPRVLCGRYAGSFARACWYRAFLERPPKRPVTSASAILAVCAGLRGVQEKGCVTGASVIRSADPFQQMQTCARLPAGFEIACARGVRVPAVALSPGGQRMGLISACGAYASTARSGCFWWLGLALNVVTNGRFREHGCPLLGTAAARRSCAEGAGSYEGPLVTFS
ncbi:MAG TPA: hypothetical protein VFA19_04240 [Gaiellaceae bacterium]|nr:hypothetical protein [Gaiellaceae bacterium]